MLCALVAADQVCFSGVYFIKDDADRMLSSSTGKVMLMHSPRGGWREKFECQVVKPSRDNSKTLIRLIHKPASGTCPPLHPIIHCTGCPPLHPIIHCMGWLFQKGSKRRFTCELAKRSSKLVQCPKLHTTSLSTFTSQQSSDWFHTRHTKTAQAY